MTARRTQNRSSYTVARHTTDPHLNETGSFGEIDMAEGKQDRIRVPTSPLESTGFDNPEARDPPRLGEDTQSVLREIGYTEDQIAELREAKIVWGAFLSGADYSRLRESTKE